MERVLKKAYLGPNIYDIIYPSTNYKVIILLLKSLHLVTTEIFFNFNKNSGG